MGPLNQVMEMIPGLSRMMKNEPAVDEREMKRVEAVILSMTPHERHHPEIIGGSRRRRIAKGSGTTAADVNAVLNQFKQAQTMMRAMAGGKVPKNVARLLR
jgi:signal recognition particle subunit SRP54